jgi:hypothetical protein
LDAILASASAERSRLRGSRSGARVKEITRSSDSKALFPRFGLPADLG